MYIAGCPASLIHTTTMRPWRIHFGGEINVKNNEIPETSTEKGGKNVQRGPGACTSIQGPGTYHMKDTFDNQPRTNLRRGLLQKAVTTRDRCVAHMLLRSCCDVRRPRHLPNAKITAILQPRPDGTTKKKSRISETLRPGRYNKIK